MNVLRVVIEHSIVSMGRMNMLPASSHPERKSVTVPIISRNHTLFRDIAVPLMTYGNAYSTNAYALSLAQMFGATVTGIAFALDPILPVTGPFDAIPAELIEELIARGENEARENATNFERQAALTDLVVTTKIIRAGHYEATEKFAYAARNFDLSVVPQGKADDNNLPNFATAALFDSGRPVIIVPYIHQSNVSLERVLVCWDGSRAAARAISDAWPLLERASAVNIVTATRSGDVRGMQQELGEHFAQHGVSAKLQTLVANDIDVGNAILSHAADTGATLILMGGYGHSRTREWILGGVTRTVLQTMTVPTFISH
jgi:nucleotide-binding universal stress UspA family protein